MTRKVKSSTLLKVLCLVSLLQLGFANPDIAWNKTGNGIHEAKINCVTTDPQNPAIVLAGTSKAVYKSTNHGQDFHPVLQIPGSAPGVNFLYIYTQNPNQVYAATDSGLYFSADRGDNWQNIFYANNPENKRCLTVLKYGQEIYLGTFGGLYSQTKPDGLWIKENNELATSPVFHLYANEEDLYVVSDKDVYRVSWEDERTDKIFTFLALKAQEESFENSNDEETPQPISQIKAIGLSSAPSLYLATIQGVFATNDSGRSWQRINMNGLPLNEITSMVILKDDQLILGTGKGVFAYSNDHWQPLYKGMETIDVSYLAQNDDTIYGATDRGLFIMPLTKTLTSTNPTNPTNSISSTNSTNEPTIQEVQQLAIHYAEVDPDKITRWRDLARKKALLPTLSAGLNRSATELYHWDSGPNPDILSKGRDYLDWDLTISWNLADIVWSTDQTTIDSRSKLMVELRQDVLDQVTRLYFERRRVQTELARGTTDPQIDTEKHMRVEELTALIDAFTGGQFSKKINQNN